MEERFVTLTQAAKILGYKSNLSVNRLVKEGHLKEYMLPLSNRPKFKVEEVMNVAIPEPRDTGIAVK